MNSEATDEISIERSRSVLSQNALAHCTRPEMPLTEVFISATSGGCASTRGMLTRRMKHE